MIQNLPKNHICSSALLMTDYFLVRVEGLYRNSYTCKTLGDHDWKERTLSPEPIL